MYRKIYMFFRINKKVVLIIFLHLLLTVPLAYMLNTWYDEAWSLNTSEGSILYAFKHSYEFEYQPPAYFMLLSLWRKIDNSYFFARLLSILFSVGSILMSYIILKKHLKINKSEFVLFLISINPFLVYYAVEIRLYTMIIFLSGVLIYLMYEIYFFDSSALRYRIIFIFLSVISLHTQYYMGFLLAAIGICVLIYKGWSSFRIFLFDMIFPALSLVAIIPFYNTISRQINQMQEMNLSTMGIIGYFRNRITSYLFASNLLPLNLTSFEVWAVLFFLALIYLYFIRHKFEKFWRLVTFKDYSALPITAVLLIFYIIIIVNIPREVMKIRHTAALFLPLMFSVASLIFVANKKKVLILWFLLLSFLYIGALFNQFGSVSKEGDSIRISRYLETHEKEKEFIFVPYDIFALPLRVHYKGQNNIISLYDNLLTQKDRDQLLRRINNNPGNFWYDFPSPGPLRKDLSAQIKTSEKFIVDNFSVCDTINFTGMQLWYLKKKNIETKKHISF